MSETELNEESGDEGGLKERFDDLVGTLSSYLPQR